MPFFASSFLGGSVQPSPPVRPRTPSPNLMPFLASPIDGGDAGGQRRRQEGGRRRRVGRVRREDLPGALERGDQGNDPQKAQVHESAVLESRDRRLVDPPRPLESALGPATAQPCSSELLAEAPHPGGLVGTHWSALRLAEFGLHPRMEA